MTNERLTERKPGMPPPERAGNNPLAAIDIVLARHSSIVLPTAREDLRSIQRTLKREFSWRGNLDSSHHALPIPLEVASRFRLQTTGTKQFDNNAIDSLLSDFGFEGGIAEIQERETLMSMRNDPEHYRRISGLPTKFQGITLEVSKDTLTGWRFLKAHLNHMVAVASVLSPDLSPIPNTREEIHIEQTLLHYYDAIDAKDLETVFSLFSNDSLGDPKPKYERGTEEPIIEGIQELQDFYKYRRKIKDGEHDLQALRVSGNNAHVEGAFTGKLKSQEAANKVLFVDDFTFIDGKIVHRVTTFPGQEI